MLYVALPVYIVDLWLQLRIPPSSYSPAALYNWLWLLVFTSAYEPYCSYLII